MGVGDTLEDAPVAYPYQSDDEFMQARWAMVARDRASLYQLTRDELIAMLVWNDHNGAYTDEDSRAEGMDPITLDEARETVVRTLENF